MDGFASVDGHGWLSVRGGRHAVRTASPVDHRVSALAWALSRPVRNFPAEITRQTAAWRFPILDRMRHKLALAAGSLVGVVSAALFCALIALTVRAPAVGHRGSRAQPHGQGRT